MILLLHNSPMPTTAGRALQQTGTAIRTMLQAKGKIALRVVEWGISLPASAAAAPPKVELLTTGTVFATSLTALAEADITKMGEAAGLAADYLELGTGTSGFNVAGAAAEGSIAATAALDGLAQIPPTAYFSKWFSLDQEPMIYKGESCRIRVTSAVDYAVSCWLRLKPA